MAASWLMVLLLALGGGDGNELLDYLPSRLYWEVKGVDLSADAMRAELAAKPSADAVALIPELGDDRFETREKAMEKIRAIGPDAIPALRTALESESAEIRNRAAVLVRDLSVAGRAREIRRLMAIRALGELKARDAEADLLGLLPSGEPFVASYARAALASIRNQDAAPPAAAPGEVRADLALIPPGCGVVGRMTVPPGRPVDYDRLLASISGFPLRGEQTPDQAAEQAARQGIAIAERIGNIRIDAVTLGVSGDIGNNAGFVVVVARGCYDAKGLRELILQETRAKPRTIAGVDVLPLDREFTLILPSDERLILAGGPKTDALPMEDLATALREGEAKQPAPETAALAGAVDTSRPLWLSMRVTEAYRSMPLLAPFEAVTLVVGREADAQHLALSARGKDAEAVKASVAIFEKGLQEAREGFAKAVQDVRMPQMKAFADLLGSIALETDGGAVTVTGTLKGTGHTAVLTPMLLFAGIRAPAPRPR